MAITVSDIVRSRDFYRDVIGGAVLFDVPEQQIAVLSIGDVRLFLSTASGEGEIVSRPLIYFGVTDVAAEWQRLGELGVELVAEPRVLHRDDTMQLEMAFFRDPDGTLLAFTEERAVS